MKRISIVLIIGVFALFSCSKESDEKTETFIRNYENVQGSGQGGWSIPAQKWTWSSELLNSGVIKRGEVKMYCLYPDMPVGGELTWSEVPDSNFNFKYSLYAVEIELKEDYNSILRLPSEFKLIVKE